jgi:hypothetical protein
MKNSEFYDKIEHWRNPTKNSEFYDKIEHWKEPTKNLEFCETNESDSISYSIAELIVILMTIKIMCHVI